MYRTFYMAGLIWISGLTWHCATAAPLHSRSAEPHVTPVLDAAPDNEMDIARPVALPPRVQRRNDIAYGAHPLQRLDVYAPVQARAAPIIFMVHGGAWRTGDKATASVVENKVARWVPQGFIVVSTNYRLLPDATPLQQAQDIAQALASVQRQAPAWGGDAAKMMVMGHSAGAHLVALLGAAPQTALLAGAHAWLGTILLDSAALDVVHIMRGRHLSLYDQAFGSDPADWRQASPAHALNARATPFLTVCSSLRRDSCAQAHRFTVKASSFGVRAQVLQQALSHKDINQQLGVEGAYTEAVEAFMGTLDPVIARMLQRK